MKKKKAKKNNILFNVKSKCNMEATKFKVGKRYGMNSACDHDCWWYYTVIERTACTITLKSDRGEIKKCRINKRDTEFFKAEAVRPLGSYSMCPILTAEKIINVKSK